MMKKKKNYLKTNSFYLKIKKKKNIIVTKL